MPYSPRHPLAFNTLVGYLLSVSAPPPRLGGYFPPKNRLKMLVLNAKMKFHCLKKAVHAYHTTLRLSKVSRKTVPRRAGCSGIEYVLVS